MVAQMDIDEILAFAIELGREVCPFEAQARLTVIGREYDPLRPGQAVLRRVNDRGYQSQQRRRNYQPMHVCWTMAKLGL